MMTAVREIQLPVLAAILLGACAAKLPRVLRTGAPSDGLGPAALFPVPFRRPAGAIVCAAELVLGVGLVATSTGGSAAVRLEAEAVRIGVALFFFVAMCALVELRARRPEAGCGCFGDLSGKPAGIRPTIRAGVLCGAAVATFGDGPLRLPPPGASTAAALGILVAELAAIAALSPEVGETLVRLGYSEPCESRSIPAERTLAALRRSSPWRRHSHLISAQAPADMWRELCWRYVVFPAERDGRAAEVVFAVQMRQRRPAVEYAVLELTGARDGSALPRAGPLGGAGRGESAPGAAPSGDRASPHGPPSSSAAF